MKRLLPLLTGALLILAMATGVVGCADKSAREQLLTRYDKITPPANFEVLPALVKNTIIAYNSQKYFDAALGFQEILKKDDLRALHKSSRYYLAESLYRLKMYQPCQWELMKILGEGPEGNTYFTSALIKLLAITYETKDKRAIFEVLSNTQLEKFPRQFQNELIYLLGRMHFDDAAECEAKTPEDCEAEGEECKKPEGEDCEADFAKAYDYFSQVLEGSAFYAKATYFKGILEVRNGDYDKAKKTFEHISQIPPVAVEFGESTKTREMSKLAMGQLYYEAAAEAETQEDLSKGGSDGEERRSVTLFRKAIEYYDQVDRENVQWFEALFEKTWAATRLGYFEISLGTSLTLSSPYFEDRFVPEIHLIEAFTWYELCKYRQAKERIEQFKSTYTDMQERVTAYLDKVEEKGMTRVQVYEDLLDQYEAAYQGKKTELTIQVLTHTLNDQMFLNFYEHIQEIDRELEILASAPEPMKSSDYAASTSKKMKKLRSALKKKGGAWALRMLEEVEVMLKELVSNAKFIALEIKDGERRLQQRAEQMGVELQNQQASAAQEEDILLTPAVPDAYDYWPFEGEYWHDELGYYWMAVVRECASD